MEWENLPVNWKKHLGFVYIIYHIKTGHYYVGKKLFWFKKTEKPLKGKKRKRRSLVESDWRTYYGSSNDFNEFVKKEGKDKFVRKIVACYDTKWDMSYNELLEQLRRDVLHDPKSYNGIISVRLRRRK